MNAELLTLLHQASETMLACGRAFLGAHAALEALRSGLHAADCRARRAAEAATQATAPGADEADIPTHAMLKLEAILARQQPGSTLTRERGLLLLRAWHNPALTSKEIGQQFAALPGPSTRYSPGSLYRWAGMLGLPAQRSRLPGVVEGATAARHATMAANLAAAAEPTPAAEPEPNPEPAAARTLTPATTMRALGAGASKMAACAPDTPATDPLLAWLQQQLGRAPDAPDTAGELAEFRMGIAAGSGARFLATTLGWPVHVAGSLAHIIRTEGVAA